MVLLKNLETIHSYYLDQVTSLKEDEYSCIIKFDKSLCKFYYEKIKDYLEQIVFFFTYS